MYTFHPLNRPNFTAAVMLIAAMALFLALTPTAGAAPPFCEDVCVFGQNCNQPCMDGHTTTCRCAGFCGSTQGCPCTPRWVQAGETFLGGYPEFHYAPDSCNAIGVYEVVLTDANHCGEPDQHVCRYEITATYPDHISCCLFHFCNNPQCPS